MPTLDRVVLPAGENDLAKHEAEAAWSVVQPGLPAVNLYRTVDRGESAYDVSFLLHHLRLLLDRTPQDVAQPEAENPPTVGRWFRFQTDVPTTAISDTGGMKHFLSRSFVTGAFLTGLIVTTACSGAPAAGTSPNASAATPTTQVRTEAQKFTLSVGKGMSFEPSAITVHAGQPIELTVRNDGQFPHDFTLTEGVTQPVKITVNAGQTASGTFTLDKAGTYNFECSMPAHALAGMRGTITAQ